MFTLISRMPAAASAAVFLGALAVGASAQQTATVPDLEKLEDIPAPSTPPSSAASKGQQITETRERGRVTEVMVTNGENTYYIKPEASVGNAMPGDAQTPTIRPPQWRIFSFDLDGANRQQANRGDPAPPAVLPPPDLAAPPANR